METRLDSKRQVRMTRSVPPTAGGWKAARASDAPGPAVRPVARAAAKAIAAACIVLAACSCGQSDKPASGGGGPVKVLCSVFPVYVFAANVVEGVPGIELSCLLPSGLGCPHGHSLSPGEMRKIAEADVFIVHGLGLEDFLGDSVRKANPRVKIIVASEGIKPIPSSAEEHEGQEGEEHGESAGGHEHESHEGHEHGEEDHHHHHRGSKGWNPHAWVSLSAAQAEVRNIAEGLGAAMPERREMFRKNAEAYCAKLAALRGEFLSAAASASNRKVVAAHDAFAYFAADIGLDVVALIEGAHGAEDGSVSAGRMIEIVELIRREKPAAIFHDPGQSRKAAETIGKETGVPVYSLDPVASGKPAPGAYEEAMRKNLGTLKAALASGGGSRGG